MRVRRIVRRMAVAGMLAVMLIAVPTSAAAQRLGEALGWAGQPLIGVIVGSAACAACAATAPACVATAAVIRGLRGSVIGLVIDGEASGRVETGPIPIGGNGPEPVPSPRPDEQESDTRHPWSDERATNREVHIHQGPRL